MPIIFNHDLPFILHARLHVMLSENIQRVYHSIITPETYYITASTTHIMRLPAKSSQK